MRPLPKKKSHMESGGCIGPGCTHPSHYAEGGKVEKDEGKAMEKDDLGGKDVDDELGIMAAEEFTKALEKKDHKAIHAALKAICLSCME